MNAFKFQYMFKKYEIDTQTFGYIMSGTALLQLLLSPVIGKFGDKFGARSVLILSATSAAIGHLSLGLAFDLPTLIGARVVTVAQDVKLGKSKYFTD